MSAPRTVVLSSDDSSAVRHLNEMSRLAANVLGEPFGVVRPENKEFYAGIFEKLPPDDINPGSCIAMGRICLEADSPSVNTIVVRHDRRGVGHGSRVLKALEDIAFVRGAPVIDIEQPFMHAVGFYRANGYEATAWNPNGSIQIMSKLLQRIITPASTEQE
jgi:GNAT superfamily N-acetyltransferase